MAKNRPVKKDNNKEKKGKKEKGVGKRMKKEAMIQAIISVFQSAPKEPFNYKQISKIIGVENQVQKLQVVDILYDLSAEDIITDRPWPLPSQRIGNPSRRNFRTPQQWKEFFHP